MINKKLFILYVFSIFFISCEKELDITEFSDDFSFYNSELRIEALILPADSTAIIRIDKSIPLDDANLYNCQDDDNDWNYYFCPVDSISYEALDDCENICDDSCIIHLFSCEVDCDSCDIEGNNLITYNNKEDCISSCIGECVTDDIGEDGKQAYDSNNDGDYDDPGFGGDIAPDIGEGNGLPDCNENNVDEYNEILPAIHLDSLCTVIIQNEEDICYFIFSDTAGTFFEDRKRNSDISNENIISYGAWVPNPNNCDMNFNNYNSEYKFSCECQEGSGYEYYGEITAVDSLVRPVIFYNKEEFLDFNNNGIWDEDLYEEFLDCNQELTICSDSTAWIDSLGNGVWNIGEPYEDLNQNGSWGRIEILKDINLNGIYDNDESKIDSCSYENNIYSCLKQNNSDEYYYYNSEDLFDLNKKNNDAKINYASLFFTKKYEAIQYIYDEANDRYVYYHGHPDLATDSGNLNNTVCIMSERVVAEKFPPYIGNDKFKYEIFTFSKGYENYYFLSQLDLADPERTNLRDKNGNPVMGGFGSMVKNIKYFQIIEFSNN